MSWFWLKSVPWGTIVANAPALVASARKLLERRGPNAQPAAADTGESDPGALAQRVRALEVRQQQMADLLESLAKSNEQLTAAAQYLRARAVWSFRLVLVLAIVVAVIAVKLLLA